MQNKGAIKLFAILLGIISIYYLSFTFVVQSVENDAKEYANGDKAKETYYLDSIANEPVYNILIRKYTYRECKEREINLGLDLKGGMNVTLEVSVPDLIKAMANNTEDPIFNKALANAKQLEKTSNKDVVTLFYEEIKKLAPNVSLSSPNYFGHQSQDKIDPYKTTNDEVINIIRQEVDAAIARSFIVLNNRINKFGVAQPNIQRLGNSGRILVELPGVKEPERVRKLLQGTANLEFWETFEYKDVYSYFEEANTKLKNLLAKDTSTTATPISQDTTKLATKTTNKDTTATKPNQKDTTKLADAKSTADTNLAKMDTAKLSQEEEALKFKKENPLFAVLAPSVYQNEQGQFYPTPGPVVGLAAIKDTSKVNAYLAMPQIKAIFPKNMKLLWSFKPTGDKQDILQLIAIKVSSADGKALIEGDKISDARKDFGQMTNKPEVTMIMNSEGAAKWKRITAENIGKSIAIVLDNYVYSYPTVQSEISGGISSITGDFTITEAEDLANVLKSGKLPAPAKIIEEAIVGPSLGKQAVSSGLMSFVIAFLLVLLYMVFYYRNSGLVADIALFVNVFFIMGVLASLGAVLTLPGIAGIVLTLGMAVDSNVIIFERIREELRAGKGIKAAISEGYKRSYSAIVDANITTFLTGVILAKFGKGPVEGFATTLIIGILTSLFTSIFISRIIFEWWLAKKKPIHFYSKFSENLFKNVNIDFIKKKKILYIVSGALILISIVSMFTRGFNLGVDFKGGRTYIVKFDQKVNPDDLRQSLQKTFGEAPEVKTFGEADQVKITTKYLIDDDSQEADALVENKLFEGVKAFYTTPITFEDFTNDSDTKTVGRLSSQKVGPTIAKDIKIAAIWAVLFSLLGIFLYIVFRFRKLEYGVGAIISLAHDSIIVLGAFSLLYGILPFSLEIDQAFIAAILTVIGYSINDTVIVYDRIREYTVEHRKTKFSQIVNMALNSTLGRTFNTSFTTIVVLIAIFIFGGEVIRGFTFALLLGILVGTYSSIFIAAQVVDDFSKHDKELEKSNAKTK